MTSKVGPKGEVVIPKAIRDRLGLRPGDAVTFEAEGRAVRVAPPLTTHAPLRRLGGAWFLHEPEQPAEPDELSGVEVTLSELDPGLDERMRVHFATSFLFHARRDASRSPEVMSSIVVRGSADLSALEITDPETGSTWSALFAGDVVLAELFAERAGLESAVLVLMHDSTPDGPRDHGR